ncbi:thioredoxin family protein [Virgibacillus byunsanensis]|uniref:Thioredoxin family protein n=1 Tax=Virgibacillus byunsanensis TaxID=570945 RepID=A0ABW3LJR5_9BACI
MQKKMLIIIGAIVVLFGALYFVIDYKNNQALDNNDNPYGKDNLNQATIDQLDDPDYGNQIVPEELNEEIDSGDPVTVYFYDPTCPHCQATTPDLVPLTEDLGIDMKKYNLLEFTNNYGIESTPTLVHYEEGKEVARIIGQRTDEEFTAFFNKFVLN